MLLHLPIALLSMTLPPIAVSDTVPKFDIAKECRFEGEMPKALDRCTHDEAEAFHQLQSEWPQFDGADRDACLTEATSAGFSSYVDLLTCLELARDVRGQSTSPRNPLARPGTQSTRPAQPEIRVIDQHK